jgi:hypothetical protein
MAISLHVNMSISMKPFMYSNHTRTWPSLVMEHELRIIQHHKRAPPSRPLQGEPLGSVAIFAAPSHPNSSYTPLHQRLFFQHCQDSPAFAPLHSRPPSARPSSALARGTDHWDRAVYDRLFLTEKDATTWAAWNSERGDPAQPYHQEVSAELSMLDSNEGLYC